MLKVIFVFLFFASSSSLEHPPACSLNGIIDLNGACLCDAGWYGDICDKLDLLPANPSNGLKANGTFNIYSSWGGSVMKVNSTFHMFAAVMEHGCGLNAWRPNSAIGHATSENPEGPYLLKKIVKPHFAHSPQVVKTTDDLFLIYHIGSGKNNTSRCPDPASPACQFTRDCKKGCTGKKHPFLAGTNFHGPISVLQSKNIDGPWADQVIGACSEVPGCEPNSVGKGYPGNGNDVNPSPLVNVDDGSIELFWRPINYTKGSGQSYYAKAHAESWNDTYAWSMNNLFPEYSWCHIEDGFFYRNQRGHFHALFHSDCEKTSGGAAGGHGFSVDGKNWFFGARNAYENNITLTDGSSWSLSRRERPKLLINDNGVITHLINGVSRTGIDDGCGAHPPNPFRNSGDHTFTFIQPVATFTRSKIAMKKSM